MFSYNDKSEVGTSVGFYNGSSFFPIGTHSWYLTHKCDNVVKELEPTMLKLSQVNPQTYELIVSQGDKMSY
jgi:hypothetical protein